jgi:LysM repeat protein
MTSTRYLALAAAALSLPSCSMFHKKEENYDTAGGSNAAYDTSNPYGVPGGTSAESVPYQPVNPPADNPTYSPAAYEENSTAANPPAKPHSSAPTTASHASPAAASGATHTVVKGDTLGGIARKYGTSSAAIKQANGMSSDTVVLGKQLVIPGASGAAVSRPAPAAKATPAAAPKTAGGKTYTVVKGDTLAGISRKHGVSVDALKKANGMKSDTVVLGSKLRIP